MLSSFYKKLKTNNIMLTISLESYFNMFMNIDFLAKGTKRNERDVGLERLFHVRDHDFDRRADLSKEYYYFLFFSCLAAKSQTSQICIVFLAT